MAILARGACGALAIACLATEAPHAQVQLAVVYDIASRLQDAESQAQVGDLPALGRIRYVRAIASGRVGKRRPWQYLVALEPSGLYADNLPAITVRDLAFTFPLGHRGHVTIGRQKEGVTAELAASIFTIPFAERATPITAFIPTRNDGIRFWGPLHRGHGGWSLGVFNDWLFKGTSLNATGPQSAGRIFWAPLLSADSNRAVHLGFDARWSGSTSGALQFRSRPEQNEAPSFLNTGSFSGSSSATLDAELMVLMRAVSFTAEMLPTRAFGTSVGSVDFVGYYAEVSWRPTNARRPYDARAGRVQRLRRGDAPVALEVALRYSRTDLDDRVAPGGVLEIPSFSLAAYGPSSTRVMLTYGFSVLKRVGLIGRAQLLTLRLQWERL